MRLGALLLIAMAAACTDAKTVVDPDATALEIAVELAPGLGVDSLLISTTGKPPAFAAGTVPESPRPLAGAQSVVVLLPAGLDGTALVIRVDGLAGGAIMTSGGARATVQAGRLVRVDVPLGDPAVCGDGKLRDPIEACDDGDRELADGCTADCTVEPGWDCTSPVNGPSICQQITSPTVTQVTVLSTAPVNGATFYNTGTATVRLTGTQLATVACPAGVELDDLDGLGALASTPATSCTVDSDTQITATFPAGIRSNSGTGWNVIATNAVGSNAVSAKLVVRAGLLISEVLFTGSNREFIELYNPTATSIDLVGLGVRVHTRRAAGTDLLKALTPVTTTVVAPHGFFLIASSVSTTESWFGQRDAIYPGGMGLGPNGGVYLNLSSTDNLQVLDKVGWGTQPTGGFEGTPLAVLPISQSVERKPAGGAGHATDTDDNANDFHPPSTAITPRGTVDGPQP